MFRFSEHTTQHDFPILYSWLQHFQERKIPAAIVIEPGGEYAVWREGAETVTQGGGRIKRTEQPVKGAITLLAVCGFRLNGREG